MTSDRWHRVQVTRLQFPALCCRCEAETLAARTFAGGRVWYLVVLERILGWETYLELPVPFCDGCAATSRRAWIKGVLIGTAISFAVVILGAVVVGSLRLRSPAITSVLGISFFVGPLVGFFLARRPNPVRLRAYRSKEGTVEIQFENARFAQQVVSAPNQ